MTLRLYCSTSEKYPLRLVDVVELFFRELRHRGVEQVWFCQPSDAKAPLRSEYTEGIRIIVPPNFGNGTAAKTFARLVYLFLEAVYLVAQLRDPPDAFLVRDKYWAAVVAWLVSRVSRRKLLIWLSYPYPEHEREEAASATGFRRLLLKSRSWLGFNLLYRLVMPRADQCFVQSDEMKRDLLKWSIPAERMTPVPMGIRKATFDAVDLSVAPEQPPVVLHLGSLSAVRRLEILVDAFAIVHRARPDARLRFVGEGDLPQERRALEERVREAGLSGAVEFTGQVPIEQAWAQVATASVCLSPVRMPLLRVASPTKFVEYLAYAKPTVGNDQPDHVMIAEQSRGAVIVEWSPERFAEGILWCLDHPGEARAMGLRGRAWVGEHRTYDRLADMVYRKLTELLTDPATPSGQGASPRTGQSSR